jgi:hypothetical protein
MNPIKEDDSFLKKMAERFRLPKKEKESQNTDGKRTKVEIDDTKAVGRTFKRNPPQA